MLVHLSSSDVTPRLMNAPILTHLPLSELCAYNLPNPVEVRVRCRNFFLFLDMVKSLAGLTGENIAKIAYAQHSIPPSGMGAVCEVLIYVFLAICTIVVGLRVYVRMFRVQNDVKWRLNDYLAVAGFVSHPFCFHYSPRQS